MKGSRLGKTSTVLVTALLIGSLGSTSAWSQSTNSNSSENKSNLTSSEKQPNLNTTTDNSFLTAQAVVNLTGRWRGNDGAIYYIRQANIRGVGNRIFWYGENSPTSPTFSNVFRATSSQTIRVGTIISGEWADVPKGTILQGGTLRFRVVTPNFLQRVNQTGNFSGSTWTRI
jgi:hypothetical protein